MIINKNSIKSYWALINRYVNIQFKNNSHGVSSFSDRNFLFHLPIIKIHLIGTFPVLMNAVNLVTNQEGKSDCLLTPV
jgi:hypothetical protein